MAGPCKGELAYRRLLAAAGGRGGLPRVRAEPGARTNPTNRARSQAEPSRARHLAGLRGQGWQVFKSTLTAFWEGSPRGAPGSGMAGVQKHAHGVLGGVCSDHVGPAVPVQ